MTDEAEAQAVETSFDDSLADLIKLLDNSRYVARVSAESPTASSMFGMDFTRELVRRALLPLAPVPAGAGERLLNLTKALLDDANQEVADLQALLTKASEEVCSNQCRSYFPAGHVRSDADHSELCHAIRAALVQPSERSASPAPASGTDEVERVLEDVMLALAPLAVAWQTHRSTYLSAQHEQRVSAQDLILFPGDLNRANAALEAARAALAALREDGTKTETGWLIERQDRGAPEWYRLVNSATPNNFWTKNAAEALRFARRADAEAYCADSGLDDPGFTVHITEHAWGP